MSKKDLDFPNLVLKVKPFNCRTFKDNIESVVDFIQKYPPSSELEFEKYTKFFYGVKLQCRCVVYSQGHPLSVKYEVQGDYEDYSKGRLFQKWEKYFRKYDGLSILLDATFGKLCCGGVSGSHYGQTCGLSEDRKEVLRNWDDTDNTLKLRIEYIKERELLNNF